MSNPFKNMKKAAPIRPQFNLFSLIDTITGRYYVGKNGESVMCGGLSSFTGVAGLPNMMKTLLSIFMNGVVLDRLRCSGIMVHDSENTLSPARLYSLFRQFPNLSGQDLIAMERMLFTDATIFSGNEWWESFKDFAAERTKDKDILISTPFLDPSSGENIKIPAPMLTLLDSLSGLQTDSVQAMYDNAEVGEKGLNMVAMKGAAAKSQLVDQVTGTVSPAGIPITMTAHIGQEYQLNQYAPNIKKLKFLKGDLKLKKVPENFQFYTSVLWYCASINTLLDSDKLPEFPRSNEDDLKGDTDLICLTIVPIRNKNGPTGFPIDIVISQSEGVKPELSEYYYCKGFDYYGLSGIGGKTAKGAQHYCFDILPEVSLNRKSIRSKMDESYALRRAAAITAELCMVRNHWHDVEPEHYIHPKILRKDIEDLGYDWDILLNTRSFWVPLEEEHLWDMPFLSCRDLLRMRAGLYRPAWYDEAVKEKAEAAPAAVVVKEAA